MTYVECHFRKALPCVISTHKFNRIFSSQTARRDGPDIKIQRPEDASLSAESIAEDIPEKSVSEDTTIHEDDTTVHDESENDARDALPREPSKKGHDSGSKLEVIVSRGKK